MGFLSRFFPNLGKVQTRGQQGYTTTDGQHGIWIYLQCNKCGEKIPVRLRTTSELQRREGPDADLGPGQYFVQKTVVGSKCYQRIDATVDFDAKYNVVDSKVTNGKLITFKEYESKDEHH
ncbi:MAG: hypothetical protein GX971_09145 [Firmicutes bacterium]|nr:hypothetical protein [Bacillota bacterium]